MGGAKETEVSINTDSAINTNSVKDISLMGLVLKRQKLQEFITDLGGHNAVELIEEMVSHDEGAVDEIFAKKLNLKVTEVRTILNRLHYRGVVEYSRTRDEEIGWYTYKWFVKPDRVVELLESKIQEEVSQKRDKLDADDNRLLFSCINKCNRFAFEIASEYSFRCPDCASDMLAVDNEQEIKVRKSEIKALNAEIKFLKGVV